MVEIPDELTGRWRQMLVEMGVLCDACDEAKLAEMEAEERRRLALAASRAFQDRARRSGIPKLLRDLRWESIDRTGSAVLAARRWAAGELPGLVLTGPVGVGKTYMAAVAAWAYLERRPLRWTSVPGLMASLSADWNAERRRAALELVDGHDALVLDDLDKTRPSPYAAEQLFGAIDARVAADAPLLVTTNLRLSELVERFPDPFGEALASRLAGYCEAHGLAGADRRTRRPRAA